MIRLILLLLLLTAGALVVALFFDRRRRREGDAIDGLRWAFVHGTPPDRYTRPATLTEFVHPGGVRFRVPAGWNVEIVEGDRDLSDAPRADGRRVLVSVTPLKADGAATPSAKAALDALGVKGERSVDVLPNGNALMKTLDVTRAERGVIASYTWRLARLSAQGVQLAVFRFPLSVDAATDVIARADLATMDREVREATFGVGPAAR